MNVKKLISNLITVLLAIILLLTLTLAISTKLSGSAPKVFGYQIMTVLSGSMEPSIHTGSIVAIKPLQDPKNLKVGDVATYKSLEKQDMLITHRIKGIKGSGSQLEYIFKGDANDAADPKPVPAANVVGQYADVTVPYVGYMLTFSKSKTGIVLLLIVPGISLIIWQIISLWRTITRLEEQKKSPENV